MAPLSLLASSSSTSATSALSIASMAHQSQHQFVDAEFDAEREEEAVALARWRRSVAAVSNSTAQLPPPELMHQASPLVVVPTTVSSSSVSSSSAMTSELASVPTYGYRRPEENSPGNSCSDSRHHFAGESVSSSSLFSSSAAQPFDPLQQLHQESLAALPPPPLSLLDRLRRLLRLCLLAASRLRPGVVGCTASLIASVVLVFRKGAPLRWAHFVSMFFLLCYLSLRYANAPAGVALFYQSK
jgi:hypothetical protein